MSSDAIKPLANAIKLTRREKEVFELLCTGLTAIEVGDKLCVNHRTIAYHADNIYKKFGCSKLILCYRKAMRMGIVQPPSRD